jgi:hypothetical protein
MVRWLYVHKIQGPEQLYGTGISTRKTAKDLGIYRKFADRHLDDIQAKPANLNQAATGAGSPYLRPKKGPNRKGPYR